MLELWCSIMTKMRVVVELWSGRWPENLLVRYFESPQSATRTRAACCEPSMLAMGPTIVNMQLG